MQLTSENYYSQEANREYMSVSGYLHTPRQMQD